jgi:protein-S-isoprenylcysteine O-methyltransferase Ste14
MKATTFEFRQRFWIISLIFFIGFFCYSIDPVNMGVWLQGMFAGASLETVHSRHELQLIFGLAAVLVALSALLRTWAAAYLQADVVHDSKIRTDSVVADGPYRHLRNPLYLALVLMAAGMGLMASRAGFVVIVAGIFIFQLRLIGREEQDLLKTQGESYAAYRKAVPRLWPSLSPRLPAGGTKPRWAQAWLSESFFWGFAIGSAAFACTLDQKYTLVITGASLAGYILVVFVWKWVRANRGPDPARDSAQ